MRRGKTVISVNEESSFRKVEVGETDFMPHEINNGPYGGLGASNCKSDFDIDGWYTPLNNLNMIPEYKSLVCDRNIKMASDKITQLLDGTHHEGKRIMVPESTIRESIVSTFRKNNNYDPAKVLEEAINEIVQYIQDDYRTLDKNNTYSVWTNHMGEGNVHGLMPNAPIKIRENGPNQIFVGGRY
jgi:hypothetical protein